MAINFFQKELSKVQERFNQTFSESQTQNLATRFNVILAIIHLGLIAKEINKDKKKDIQKVRDFMQAKAILNKAFDSFKSEMEIRKQNENQIQMKGKEKETCNQKSSTRFVRSAEC